MGALGRLLVVLLAAAILAPQAAMADNYMLSGEELVTGDWLRWSQYKLVMQADCNLVLHNGGWETHTAHKGTNCRAVVTYNGELQVRNGEDIIVWRSKSPSHDGSYATIIHPNGILAVYGPVAWSSDVRGRYNAAVGGHRAGAGDVMPVSVPTSQALGNIRHENNVLFSDQILYNDGKLVSGIYQMVMENNCNLQIYNGDFSTDTQGAGKNCFLRLDHYGGLEIRDDAYNLVWSNRFAGREGQYLLLLQEDGTAEVRGPAIWSTQPL